MAMSTEEFKEECRRRLIDTYSLSVGLGLRSKQAVWIRVEKGLLPEPIIKEESVIALWDRDAIPALSGE
jgi:hypothetical protein